MTIGETARAEPVAFAAHLGMRFLRRLALSAVMAGTTACGGGGGGGGASNTPAPAPPPPQPVTLADAIPASGATIDPATSGLNLIHLANADWQFEYAGDCGTTGVTVRHALTDLSGSGDDREIVDHKLACRLEPGVSYAVRVDATDGDGTRHRATMEFATAGEPAARGVTVVGAATLSRGAVDGLFRRYVRDAVLDEISIPVIGTLIALIVAEIAEQSWTELGARGATYGVVSKSVSYPSRSPSGASATLSGLVAMPDLAEDPDYQRPNRIVVLTHATGATPSHLDRRDGWYVLANVLAGRGHLVVVPDNWGRGSTGAPDQPETYLLANRVGRNALDMVRQVLADARYAQFHDGAETAELAIIGYSQGAHSAIGMWLAAAALEEPFVVRDVYAGGGPHNLYDTFVGVLERVADRCEGGPWCRAVDPDAMVPYATDRILPAYVRYLDVGLTLDDLLDGKDLAEAFVTGMLDGEERFDPLKAMLQLNTFTNALDLAGTIPSASTRIHLYHSRLDRLLPQQNSRDLADALFPGFDVATRFDICDSGRYERLGDLIDEAGVVHALCAFEMFDRALRDLRCGDQACTTQQLHGITALDPGLPWREAAERHAAAALADPAGLAAFRATRSSRELHDLAERLRVSSSPVVRELANQLR